ncbi:hypothetical protein GCM10022410_16060 [Amphibacillus indicireducens]|uniref:Uncharacterized protein n=1 Tax=Amphibacillus indicireducens TaxID=1076330 RepID=A0ABP7VP58_9BACI
MNYKKTTLPSNYTQIVLFLTNSTFADQNVQVNVGMVRKMGCSLSILTLFVHAGNLITDP